MDELLGAIGVEFATLKSGLEDLLGQLQSANRAVRTAKARAEAVTATVGTEASRPGASDLVILSPVEDRGHERNGHTTAHNGPLAPSVAPLTGNGTVEGSEGGTAPLNEEREERTSLPRTWEQVRGLSDKKMQNVLACLGLERKRGKGSHMQNCQQIWDRICLDSPLPQPTKGDKNNGLSSQ